MSRYRLTLLAVSDLDDIWDYTTATWGQAQADRYVADLFACFEEAVSRPETGTDRSQFVKGARTTKAGRHMIDYQQIGDGITIVRIVHERRKRSGAAVCRRSNVTVGWHPRKCN